jgi:hypothetical protein
VWLRELKWWLNTYEEGVYILAGKEISPVESGACMYRFPFFSHENTECLAYLTG